MWNRRKDEEFVPKSLSVPPTSSELAKEGIPMSTLPGRPNEPQLEARNNSSATLGKSVIVKGQIFSREDLYVDGDVEGTIEALEHKLTVGPNGTVQATVKAASLTIR